MPSGSPHAAAGPGRTPTALTRSGDARPRTRATRGLSRTTGKLVKAGSGDTHGPDADYNAWGLKVRACVDGCKWTSDAYS